ncbi:uncharacterized protein KY384_001253 [Bacidia gigantensis]|uniref:uncharacterized protein n=1 Tax=Bacidia gigantensis TaxID=2732470 RepID=UPI001D04D2B2|nr:uncharacterized protein KY384_001253 [Bacidia gigantensis]KAG8534408.1 hypothetical protein KY384_001253 [Bacidia gigantensis]
MQVSAGCYSDGGQVGDKDMAASKINDICTNHLTGAYDAGASRHACLPDGKNRWDFTVKSIGKAKQNLPLSECISGLIKETSGCASGGSSSYTDWAYTADPNAGACKSDDVSVQPAPDRRGRLTWNMHDRALVRSGFTVPKETYDRAKQGYCQMVQDGADALTSVARYIERGRCQSEACILVLEITFQVGGEFVHDRIPTWCSAVFDDLYGTFQGNGGTADIDIGAETGMVSVTVGAEDRGEKCHTSAASNEMCGSGST